MTFAMVDLVRLESELQHVIGTRRAYYLSELVAQVQGFLTIMSAPCCGPTTAELYHALERLGFEKRLQDTINEIMKEDEPPKCDATS